MPYKGMVYICFILIIIFYGIFWEYEFREKGINYIRKYFLVFIESNIKIYLFFPKKI
jgi:hypothetical protein